jgi:2-methylaconitate cis-trans-isomerase PrpF
MIDAANACVFVNAADVGLNGTEMPEALEQNIEVMKKLGAIRLSASVAMGIGKNLEDAATKPSVPFIGFVSGPQDSPSLSGNAIKAADVDVTARMLSNGQPHRALPLTCTICIAIAARIEGSIVHAATRAAGNPDGDLRIAMPSGVLTVGAAVRKVEGQWHAEQGAVYRTQRRMFEGSVLVRASRVPGLLGADAKALQAA